MNCFPLMPIVSEFRSYLEKPITMPIKHLYIFRSHFNSPTKAHYELVKYFASMTPKLLVLPVFVLLKSEEESVVYYDIRKQMCQLAFREFENVNVSDIEAALCLDLHQAGLCQKTELDAVNILTFITNVGKSKVELHYIIEADTYCKLQEGLWENTDKISRLATLEVVKKAKLKDIKINLEEAKKNNFGIIVATEKNSNHEDIDEEMVDEVKVLEENTKSHDSAEKESGDDEKLSSYNIVQHRVKMNGLEASSIAARAAKTPKKLRECVQEIIAEYIIDNKLYSFAKRRRTLPEFMMIVLGLKRVRFR